MFLRSACENLTELGGVGVRSMQKATYTQGSAVVVVVLVISMFLGTRVSLL